MAYEIVEKLKKQIAAFTDTTAMEDVGMVTEAGDGIVKISGLRNALSQELLAVGTEAGEVSAVVFNLEEGFIGAVLLGNALAVKVGDRVKQTGKVISIQVGDEMIGRVVDPLGSPLDGKGVIGAKKDYAIERTAPSVVARQSVNTPVHTGLKGIDAMIPIGRGQR